MAADFTYTPDYVFTETPQYKTLISTFENGVEQRRAKRSASIKSWKLMFNNRTKTDADAIKSFLNTKLGAFTSFTWVNPNDNTQYTVRFIEDSIDFALVSYQIYTLSFSLVEVK